MGFKAVLSIAYSNDKQTFFIRRADAISESGWKQSCPERIPQTSGKKCGERNFQPLPGLKVGDASPGKLSLLNSRQKLVWTGPEKKGL